MRYVVQPTTWPCDLRRKLRKYGLRIYMMCALSACAVTKSVNAPPKIQIANHAGQAGDKVVLLSRGLIGSKYLSGGITPTGFDCSGLVMYTYQQALGVKLPHNARAQAAHAAYRGNDWSGLSHGDLVLFNNYTHVGIYIGRGLFIHAPEHGRPVRVDKLNQTYWRKHFDGGYSFFVNN